ncbi:MAG: nuclear transport factor 2 family protein [Candidatus Promineifilaceae bacterium]
MNHRFDLRQLFVPFLVTLLLLGAVTLLVMHGGRTAAIQLPSLTAIDRSKEEPVDLAGQERAADISAFRWQAMAKFYEKNGMLTRDNFDYEQAADNLAYRWQAMARFYEKNGMLTRDPTPISAAVAGYAERLNAGDLEGALAYFDDNAIFYMLGLPPDGFEMLRGKEQIRGMFAENIASHFKMEVEVLSAKDNVVTARVTTWHDFTREIGVAPVEATSIYAIKDGKIASESWHVSEASVGKFKRALAEMMPAETEAEAPVETPASEMQVTIAGGTCLYEGPLALQAGQIAVTLDVQDLDREKYALTFFTLDPGRDMVDLMASTVGDPPSWAHFLALPNDKKPGEITTFNVTMKQGPVYAVCWSSPPDLAIGRIGPFSVVP